MRITLTCSEHDTLEMTVEVWSLHFDPVERTFSMPLCMGDDWLQRVTCSLPITPGEVDMSSGRIRFERYEDIAAFGAWLIEAERQVREGFRTMRG